MGDAQAYLTKQLLGSQQGHLAHIWSIPSELGPQTVSFYSLVEFTYPPLPLKSYPCFKASSFTHLPPNPSSLQKKFSL